MKPIRVNFRAKTIISEEDERLFEKVKEYHLHGSRWQDLKLAPGVNCFKDEVLAYYINDDNSTLKLDFVQKIQKHLNKCDLCLAKTIKFENDREYDE